MHLEHNKTGSHILFLHSYAFVFTLQFLVYTSLQFHCANEFEFGVTRCLSANFMKCGYFVECTEIACRKSLQYCRASVRIVWSCFCSGNRMTANLFYRQYWESYIEFNVSVIFWRQKSVTESWSQIVALKFHRNDASLVLMICMTYMLLHDDLCAHSVHDDLYDALF